MPTFSLKLKDELVDLELNSSEEIAMLKSLLQINGMINISSTGIYLEFKSKNLKVAKKVEELINKHFKIEPIFIETKELRFHKDDLYIVRQYQNPNILLSSLSIMASKQDSSYNLKKDLPTEELRIAYLKGAFLATGSINDPEADTYHLEIQTFNSLTAYNLRDLMNVFDLKAKISKNRRGYIVYLKSADKIADFIRILGSSESLFYFEDYRIDRDLSNSINRVINCEIANQKKTSLAASRQIKEIEIVLNYYRDRLKPNLKEACDLRVKYPEDSLMELSVKSVNEFNKEISKSALNHRFRAVHELYLEIIRNREKQVE